MPCIQDFRMISSRLHPSLVQYSHISSPNGRLNFLKMNTPEFSKGL